MPTLSITVPLAAIPRLLDQFGYDPALHGPDPADQEAFVRGKVVDYLKLVYLRNERRDYEDTFTPGDSGIG